MLTPDVDVVVIGAGIHGAGVTQAVAAAGWTVAVLEQTAVAAGTSRASSKLIHGGLRYLEGGHLGLVRECLRERAILCRVAPHLVSLRPFHFPVYRTTSRRPLTIRAGLSLYAILGGLGRDVRFRRLPESDWATLDGLKTDELQAVYQYNDGQTDDRRLTEAVLASAVELGATALVPAALTSAEYIDGVWHVSYDADGTSSRLLSRVLVNAAGPWANDVLDRVVGSPDRRAVDLVQGAHIEVPGTLANGIYYVEAPSDRRPVFAIPWRDRIMVGTTETLHTGPPETCAPTASEERYLLETLAAYFPEMAAFTPDDILARWAGLRVLPKSDDGLNKRARDVVLLPGGDQHPGLFTIYGGKLTAYRATAEQLMRQLPLEPRPAKARTDELRLPELPSS